MRALNVKIEEVNINLPEAPRRVKVVWDDGDSMSNWPANDHEIPLITSHRTNKRWVMDLCGGQCEIYQPLHEWTEYYSSFGAHFAAVYLLGFTSNFFTRLAEIKGTPSWNTDLWTE
jgi:hypothetical protein